MYGMNTIENQILELQRERDEFRDKIENLKKELVAYSDKLDGLSFENKQEEIALERIGELEKIIATLSKENAFLKERLNSVNQIAYFDMKFQVNNLNAFNERLNHPGGDVDAVALVDVWNMKMINEEYDEETGDDVISLTVNALVNVFGPANVYRVRGAQFGIILGKDKSADIQRLLEIAKNNLYDNDDIEIVYGYVLTENCSSKGNIYNEVLAELKKKRAEYKSDSAGDLTEPIYETAQMYYPEIEAEPSIQAVQTPLYESVPKTEFVKQEVSIEKEILENILEEDAKKVVNENPNISSSIYAGMYDEESHIVETDVTSIDLAYEIMNMYNSKNK